MYGVNPGTFVFGDVAIVICGSVAIGIAARFVERKTATASSGASSCTSTEEEALERALIQRAKTAPLVGTAMTRTMPASYHEPSEAVLLPVILTEPRPEPLVRWSIQYWTVPFHCTSLSLVIAKVAVVPEPLAGALPCPVHPVTA